MPTHGDVAGRELAKPAERRTSADGGIDEMSARLAVPKELPQSTPQDALYWTRWGVFRPP
jgi:hypothetical protein